MMYDPLASYSSMSSFFIRFPSADRDQVREPVLVGGLLDNQPERGRRSSSRCVPNQKGWIYWLMLAPAALVLPCVLITTSTDLSVSSPNPHKSRPRPGDLSSPVGTSIERTLSMIPYSIIIIHSPSPSLSLDLKVRFARHGSVRRREYAGQSTGPFTFAQFVAHDQERIAPAARLALAVVDKR